MSSEQDRELLELAAKAVGLKHTPTKSELGLFLRDENGVHTLWNPLTSDADALRLAVKLRMSVVLAECECCCRVYARELDDDGLFERFSPDFPDATSPDAATTTRRCITRAAAALAKGEGN